MALLDHSLDELQHLYDLAAAAAEAGQIEAFDCPASEMPYQGGRLPGDCTVRCPSCTSRVLVIAALDGGPGGVYEPHPPGEVRRR